MDDDARTDNPAEEEESEAVTDPAGLIRVARMMQALTAEVRELELDDAGRSRLFDIQRNAMAELTSVISDDLEAELHQLGLPLEDPDASASELRLAQSQLVGWLNGLFQGIQATIIAQQQGSTQQLQQLRRPQLPGQTGQYL